MRITLFTSNQPRHIALAETLSRAADELCVVSEVTTVFPGQVADFFKKSEVMGLYFRKVLDAQRCVFGDVRSFPKKARVMPVRIGDLNMLSLEQLKPVLGADLYVVFGASFIKGPLMDFLAGVPAYNIHMGVSPYYRGNSCNFWACYDGNFDHVGATIHRLTKGLDSGEIYFHAFPPEETDPFVLGMSAVKSAHEGLAEAVASGALGRMVPQAQDRSREIRYTRNADFNDEVAGEYLKRPVRRDAILASLRQRDTKKFFNPYFAKFAPSA
jgi:hypothetical protein